MKRRLVVLGLLALLCTSVQAQVAIKGVETPCDGGLANIYPCANVNLLSFLPIADIGGAQTTAGANVMLNDIWGWTDPTTGHEYAIVGRSNGTAFVDVTNPVQPVFLGMLPTHSVPSNWRDIKVYKNHAFIVSEAPGHGMQVFDLTQLRNHTGPAVTFTETAHYDKIGSSHNIVINEESGFAYTVGTRGEGTCLGLYMINIQTPTQPSFMGCYSDIKTRRGYTHDAQCVRYHGPDTDYRGKEICVASNENAISIVDVSNKNLPVAIGLGSYPDASYVHQGWFTEDQRYFFQNDELDERNVGITHTRTLIWDLTDLEDPILLGSYSGTTTSIDHNLYVKGQLLFEANYTSGLRIISFKDIANPREVAFFDTVVSNDNTVFDGAWSVYPYFNSSTVVVSSMFQGLFVLKPTIPIPSSIDPVETPETFILSDAYPNPFNPQTTLMLNLPQDGKVQVIAYDALGRQVALLHDGLLKAGSHPVTFNADGLPGGTYLIRAIMKDHQQTRLVTLAK